MGGEVIADDNSVLLNICSMRGCGCCNCKGEGVDNNTPFPLGGLRDWVHVYWRSRERPVEEAASVGLMKPRVSS